MAFFNDVVRDFRFGLRNIRKSPAFTSMAVGSLALGIGASTAMYSVIHAVVISPFPYKDVEHLMSIQVREAGKERGRTDYTVDQYVTFAQRSSIFEGVIASTISDVLWTGDGEPRRLRGNHVSMNAFDIMGVGPVLGRTLTPHDAEPDAEPVAILSYKFWKAQFAGDPGVLGRKLRLNNKVRTIVGVMPRRFMFRGPDVYLPVVYRRGETPEGVRYVHVLGRVKPGVTGAQAEADLKPIIDELKQESPKEFPDKWRVSLLPFTETFPSGIRDTLWILFGAVGLLFLISCVNVSNLLLSKAAARSKEVAVRASLGASRFRIIRQLLAEALLMAVVGGSLGIALAYAGLRGIISVVPPYTIPDEAEIAINMPVLIFTSLVAVAAALLFGIAPALHLAGKDLTAPLKETGRGTAGSTRQSILRSGLVVGEVALSLILLVGASLMLRTVFARQSVDLGIPVDQIVTMRVPVSDEHYPDTARKSAFFAEVLRRVRTVPGIAAAGLNSGVHPLGNFSVPVEVPSNAQPDNRVVMIHSTDENYPAVVRLSLVQGRLLDEHEVARAAHVTLVNESFVHRYFPSGNALGQVVRIPRLRTAPFRAADDSFQIVGVLRDTLNRAYTNETIPEMHVPYTTTGIADRLIIRASGQPMSIVSAVRAQILAVDKDQPVTDIRTVESMLNDFVYARPRFNLLLLTIFATVGLSLALLGIYGVISNGVSQRSHEIGIRMALGATFSDVLRMVLSSGLKLIGLGIVVGLIGSFASVRVLSKEVWSISTFDPYSFAGVCAVVLATGLLACLWPASSAGRIDPVKALRHE